MDTFNDAEQFIRDNEAPFWWLFSGNSKVGQNAKESDVNASIDLLRKAVNILPPGSYKLECTDKVTNRSGSFKFPFTKGSNGQTSTVMQPAQSLNPYGIDDFKLKHIQEETRFRLKVEQMIDKFDDFIEEWPAYKKKIDTMHEYLKDENEDGLPDILESAKKVSQIAQAGVDIKKVFAGGDLFAK